MIFLNDFNILIAWPFAVTESYVDFELYISHTYDFIQELLSKGAAVEVLKPQSLRDKIKAEIQNMQTLYRL